MMIFFYDADDDYDADAILLMRLLFLMLRGALVLRAAPPLALAAPVVQWGEMTGVLDGNMHDSQNPNRKCPVPKWVSSKLRGRRAFVV